MPPHVLAADDFCHGVTRMRREDALRRKHIAPDPAGHLTALRFDVDRFGAGDAWIDAGLPPPNIIIRNPANGHAHLIYMLRVWMRTDGTRGWREVRYAEMIDRAMTHALAADPAYSGRFQKNPMCAEWDVVEVRAEPYSLRDLAAYLDIESAAQGKPRISGGLGRNVVVFDRLRRWAYRKIAEYSRQRRDHWDAAVAAKAYAIAADVRTEYGELAGGHAYRDSEVRATARSVARWTWDRYVTQVPPALFEARAIVDAERARIRATNSRRAAGAVTRAEYLSPAAARRSKALLLRAAGESLRSIAAKLGICVAEAYRLLSSPCVQGSCVYQNLSAAVAVAKPSSPAATTTLRQPERVVSRRVEGGSTSAARTGEAGVSSVPEVGSGGSGARGLLAYIRQRCADLSRCNKHRSGMLDVPDTS